MSPRARACAVLPTVLAGVIALAGCEAGDLAAAGTEVGQRTGDKGASEVADAEIPGDSAPPYQAEVTEEQAEGTDSETLEDWIFQDTKVHTVELTISTEDQAALDAAPYEWAHGSVAYDGLLLEDVGVRLRGKIGSFRTLAGKPKFKISFNQWVPDQRFYGLEELALNNSVVDHSYLKEPMAALAFQLAGVPVERVAFAKVYVNETYYGLYQVVEVPNDRFLREHYADHTGNLYDGKYVYYGNYSYTLLDFGIGVDALYQLEEGTDVGNADIMAVSERLTTLAGRPEYYRGMANELDWEAIHKEWATEQFIGHNDGYCLNTNNNRVYFDPSDGLAELIPWDFDYGFLNDSDWGMSWASPRGQLAANCWRDTTCYAAQQEAVAAMIEAVDQATLLEKYDDLQSLIKRLADEDPKKETDGPGVHHAQEGLRIFIAARHDYMKAAWGL